jgi:hypothetical protein
MYPVKNQLTAFLRIFFFFLLIQLILSVKSSNAQQQNYPRITGYFSIANPIATFNKNGITSNFSNVYTVFFPFGINILKSDQFGVSFEVAPAIRTENNISKVNNILFHPGAMFRFKHGFTIIGRLAFETNSRFGFTPVFNQVVKKSKNCSYFISTPIPVRFGNNLPASIGTALQVGVLF